MQRLLIAVLVLLPALAFGQAYEYTPPVGYNSSSTLWGGKIYTQEELLPRFTVRIDEFRADIIDTVTPFLTEGLDITLSAAYGTWGAREKNDARYLIALAASYGAEIEWVSAGNYYFSPTYHGHADAGFNDNRDYVDMTNVDWEAEFDPSGLEAFVGKKVTGLVYPPFEDKRMMDFAQLHPDLMRFYLEKYSYLWAQGEIRTYGAKEGYLALHPFTSGNSQTEQHFLSTASAPLPRFAYSQIENERFMLLDYMIELDDAVVERSGSEAWSAADEEWSLETKLPHTWADNNGTAYYGWDNNWNTFRGYLGRVLGTGGGSLFIGQSAADGELTNKSFLHPVGSANATPALYPGSSSGFYHQAAIIQRLQEFGFIRVVNQTERVRWLASTPEGAKNLRVAGREGLSIPHWEIGDTHGVWPNDSIYEGGVYRSLASNMQVGNQHNAFLDSAPEDGWLDGLSRTDLDPDTQVGDSGRWLMDTEGLQGRGKYNISLNDGQQPKWYIEWPNIIPGDYKFTMRFQGPGLISYDSLARDMQIFPMGYMKWRMTSQSTGDAQKMARVYQDTTLAPIKIVERPFAKTFVDPDVENPDPYGIWHNYEVTFTVPSAPDTSLFDPEDPALAIAYPHAFGTGRTFEVGPWFYNFSVGFRFMGTAGTRHYVVDELSLRYLGDPE